MHTSSPPTVITNKDTRPRRRRRRIIDYKALHNGKQLKEQAIPPILIRLPPLTRKILPPQSSSEAVVMDRSINVSNHTGSLSTISITDPETTASPAPQTYKSEARRNKIEAQKARREKTLRSHPYAEDLGPKFVKCSLCKRVIKLSNKSDYDDFHWKKHIIRCKKKSRSNGHPEVINHTTNHTRHNKRTVSMEPPYERLTVRLSARRPNPGVYSSSCTSDVAMKEGTPESGMSQSPSPPSLDHASSPSRSSHEPPSSPNLETPPPPSPRSTWSEQDELMEKYYRTSRRRGIRELSAFTIDDAQAWTWSRVKAAVWK